MVAATAVHRTDQTLITADAGYHSADNLKPLAEMNVPALIADNGMRQRDERFKEQGKDKQLPDPLYDKAHPKKREPNNSAQRTLTTTLPPAPASVLQARRPTRTAPTASATSP